ncbi:Leucine-rich repeat-containing protein [Cynara cardunculus var. scolymus]|uniref:Leucine-rich repeat-containing protein n=1 Tax=Cynara cardunculus var. scolymus TaxID=59895 RepID=A0A103YA48_CYNCS|nr:Leucine-rich repeat-containing protein [Cynara cardunculus var. scolymus]
MAITNGQILVSEETNKSNTPLMMAFTRKSAANFVIVMIVMLSLIGKCVNGGNGEYEGVGGGAPMVKTEKEALYSAIQGFVGEWWNGSDLYPDPCGWTPIQGISCDIFDGFWYVTDLNIGSVDDNFLACAPYVEFRPHLFQLNHLKSLAFFHCFVAPIPIPIPSGNWPALSGSLESLEFRSNLGLEGKIPADFGQLRKLQSLVLTENGLSGGLPENIGNLTRLKRLVLSGNGFTGEIRDSYGYLSELLILDLSRNSLSGSLPLTFGGEISNLKNLTLLDLSNNKISGGLIKSIQEMYSLEELVLSRNPIGDDLMNIEWQNLQGLMVLDLSSTQLTGGIPESLSQLKKLRFLGLNNNNLSGNLSPKLAELPNLSSLYVYGNHLTGELKFSQRFYGKMGRRFGAWNNSNLCFSVGLKPTSFEPFGVKACQEVMTSEVSFRDSGSKIVNGNKNRVPHFKTSLSSTRCTFNSRWCMFWMIILFNFFM